MSAPHADDQSRSGGSRSATTIDGSAVPRPRPAPGSPPDPVTTADGAATVTDGGADAVIPSPRPGAPTAARGAYRPDDGPDPAPDNAAPGPATASTPTPGPATASTPTPDLDGPGYRRPVAPAGPNGPVRPVHTGPPTPPMPWSAVPPIAGPGPGGPPGIAPGPAPRTQQGPVPWAFPNDTLQDDGADRTRRGAPVTLDAAYRSLRTVPHRAAAIAVGATFAIAIAVAAHLGVAGGDAGVSGTDRPASSAPGAPLADLLAGTSAADPTAFGASPVFVSPTGNIACRIEDGEARCDVRNRSWTANGSRCAEPGLVVGGTAGARASCDGAPVPSDGAQLGYRTSLTSGDVTCVSKRSGVECRNVHTGHGFTAARASYSLY